MLIALVLFSGLHLQDYTKTQAQAPDRVTESPAGITFTVKPGDLHSNGARAEVIGPRNKEGDDVWYRWTTSFPSGFVTPKKWAVWTQWHQDLPLGNGGPPLAFELHGEVLRLRVQAGLYDAKQDWSGGVLWKAPLRRGVPTEYLLHVKWAKVDGLVELWVDGASVASVRHSTLDVDGVVYMKLGMYRDRETTTDTTVTHAGMTMYDKDPRPQAIVEAPPVVLADAGTVVTPPAVTPPKTVEIKLSGCTVGTGFSWGLLAVLGALFTRRRS